MDAPVFPTDIPTPDVANLRQSELNDLIDKLREALKLRETDTGVPENYFTFTWGLTTLLMGLWEKSSQKLKELCGDGSDSNGEPISQPVSTKQPNELLSLATVAASTSAAQAMLRLQELNTVKEELNQVKEELIIKEDLLREPQEILATLISYIDSQNLERGSTYDIQSEMAILHMKKVHYVLEDQSLYDTVNIPSIQVSLQNFTTRPIARSVTVLRSKAVEFPNRPICHGPLSGACGFFSGRRSPLFPPKRVI